MDIHVLFGQRKEDYPDQYAPEVLTAWDECSIDDNPSGWEDEVESLKKQHAECMAAMRVIVLKVDGDDIRKALLEPPTLKAEIR